MKIDFWRPVEYPPSLTGVAEQNINLRGAQESRIKLDILVPVQFHTIKREFQEFLHGMAHAGRDHEVVRLLLLHHQPHRLDVISGKSPIALGLQVTELQL